MTPALIVLGTVAGLGLTVTKVVDTVRNLVNGKFPRIPKATWNFVAFGVGVLYCVGWPDVTNFVPDAMKLVPRLAPLADKFTGFSGQLLSGLVLGAVAGFWHELLDKWSNQAKAAAALAAANTPATIVQV